MAADKLADPPADKPATKKRGGWRGSPNSLKALSDINQKPQGRPLPAINPERTDLEEGVPNHLAAIRWVLEQDRKLDDTPLKKTIRQQFEANPRKFIDDKAAMERAWLESKAPAAQAAGAAVADVEAPFPELEEAWGQFQEWCHERDRNADAK